MLNFKLEFYLADCDYSNFYSTRPSKYKIYYHTLYTKVKIGIRFNNYACIVWEADFCLK